MKSLIKEMLHAFIAGEEEAAKELMKQVLEAKGREHLGVEAQHTAQSKPVELTEGIIRHVRAGLARSHEHFGTIAENSDGYRNFRKALELLNAEVPRDKVYAYTASEFPIQFKALVRKLGLPVTFDEMGDVVLLKSAGFVKEAKRADTTFYKKENVVFMIKTDAECTVLVLENE